MYTFNTGPLFKVNYENEADIVVNQGGTDSGKTVAILQVLCTIATCTEPPQGGDDPVITIVGESVPNLKKGAWRKMEGILADENFRKHLLNPDTYGDRVLRFKSGWVMEFISVFDEQSAKNGKRQYLFFNEANGMPWMVFWQMAKRTRIRIFLDYNPSAPFWVHEKLCFGMEEVASSIHYAKTMPSDLRKTVCRVISDHRHNPFLSKKEHDATELIKDVELNKVYARGLTGNLTGLIYTNWQKIPNKDFPWKVPGKFGGLDFGYSDDPCAGSRMVRVGKNIYVHELFYETNMTATMIKGAYKAEGFGSETPIYCDHDKDMIRELRMKSMLAIPARKGPNSVAPGIHKVKEYNVFYTETSSNIDFEVKRYMWLKDPVSGKFLKEPVGGNDHHMDEIRYGVVSRFYRGAA